MRPSAAPLANQSAVVRSTHSKCTRSCWPTIVHLIVSKTLMICVWKNFSVRSQFHRKRAGLHTCEMPSNCTLCRETTRNPFTVCEVPIKKIAEISNLTTFCGNTKNRKIIVDCFPALERRDRTCQRASTIFTH